VVVIVLNITYDCSISGKHDIKKDKKGYSKELRQKKDAKSSAVTLQVHVSVTSF